MNVATDTPKSHRTGFLSFFLYLSSFCLSPSHRLVLFVSLCRVLVAERSRLSDLTLAIFPQAPLLPALMSSGRAANAPSRQGRKKKRVSVSIRRVHRRLRETEVSRRQRKPHMSSLG